MSFKIKLIAFAGCVVSCLISGADKASAQDAYLARIYGDGVHQYFRNDTNTARCRFNSVIDQGSRDPRAYYFRAIMALESGDTATAQSDITTGARYELEGRGTYDIWSAFDRVQGSHRIKFECMRNNALLALRKQSVIDRYPLNYSNDPEKLRRPADPYRTDLEPDVPSLGGDDPFMNEDEPPQAPLDLDDEQPVDEFEPMDDADDDLGDEFNEPMEDPQPEVDNEDPFGDDASAEEDPFGGDAESMDDLPVEDSTPDDSDPFGDDTGGDLGGDEMGGDDLGGAAEELPAGDGDDPFADDGDDPFGDIFE